MREKMVSGQLRRLFMMTSWHGNAFRTTGPLSGDSTGGYSSQRASSTEIIFFYWQWCGDIIYHILVAWRSCWTTVELLVIWDAMMPMWRHCNVVNILRFQHYFNKNDLCNEKLFNNGKTYSCIYLHLAFVSSHHVQYKVQFRAPGFQKYLKCTWTICPFG